MNKQEDNLNQDIENLVKDLEPLIQQIKRINDQAVVAYTPLVDDLYRKEYYPESLIGTKYEYLLNEYNDKQS